MKRAWVAFEERRGQVLNALAGGPLSQAQLAAAIAVKQACVSKVVRRMLDEGDVRLAPSMRATGHGPWPMRYVVARQQHDGNSLDPARVAPEERSHRPPAGVLPSGECKVSTT